mmetsp:Transcript_31063/g.95064  ORF Transcript_31063/g.95064 Transcript_31063/m.95064 type:complete len:206 (-) Transcript_31063:50-667(-)
MALTSLSSLTSCSVIRSMSLAPSSRMRPWKRFRSRRILELILSISYRRSALVFSRSCRSSTRILSISERSCSTSVLRAAWCPSSVASSTVLDCSKRDSCWSAMSATSLLLENSPFAFFSCATIASRMQRESISACESEMPAVLNFFVMSSESRARCWRCSAESVMSVHRSRRLRNTRPARHPRGPMPRASLRRITLGVSAGRAAA